VTQFAVTESDLPVQGNILQRALAFGRGLITKFTLI